MLTGLHIQGVVAVWAQEDIEEPPRVRGQGRQPGGATHVQGVVAALGQEGLEELCHVEGQEGQR